MWIWILIGVFVVIFIGGAGITLGENGPETDYDPPKRKKRKDSE